jgi:hypothetical protein
VTHARTRGRVVVHRANGNGRNFRDHSIRESQAAFSRSDRRATQSGKNLGAARRRRLDEGDASSPEAGVFVLIIWC